MTLSAPKLVLFDCDGTLVDSQVMIVSAMTRAFETSGLAPPPREAVLSIVGLSLPIAIARLLTAHPDLPVDPLVEAYKAAFFELRQSLDHQEPLFPFARETIEELAARPDVLLGVVTGKSRRGLTAILALHGLADHFAVLRTADDAPSKPDPTMVLDAVAAVGGEVERTVVVGDTTFDIEMARAAGSPSIGVSWGYHPPEALTAAGARTVIDDFRVLPGLVTDLFA
ncbi:HAD-IA family hydrolase [Chthonobacter rhizosphaerae]|uniref:HAD-IA family hydrolase n=1 Tax=Chthonobacter rhizosphaerae TaxID=2735553 RepID=UPI0015EF26E4|nr:HAD-IA family hydrolase [Chthonobacter rhizosphaerae]